MDYQKMIRFSSDAAKARRLFGLREINHQIVEFIAAHAVRTVAGMEGILGCPHEEGADYPQGGVCPACPYWAPRDRWTGETIH